MREWFEDFVVDLLKKENELSNADILRVRRVVNDVVDTAARSGVYMNDESACLDMIHVTMKCLVDSGYCFDLNYKDKAMFNYSESDRALYKQRIEKALLNRRFGRVSMEREGD